MSASTEPKKRRAWLAALLSLLLPGLGQFYNRDTRSALFLMAAAILIPIPGLWMLAALPPGVAVVATALFFAIVAALTLYAIVQAAIGAIRQRTVLLAWFNRWHIYIGLIILLTVWQNFSPLLPIPRLAAYSMPSAGMTPTTIVWEYFAARSMAFADRLPDRGELAIVGVPHEPEVDFMKRVIGLPGDRIGFRDGRLYLNGALIERAPLALDNADSLLGDLSEDKVYRETLSGSTSYLIAEMSDDSLMDNVPEIVVPAGHVFALGDNRDRSNDSRGGLGFIPISGLRDKPLFILWSSDLSRIGKVLE